MRLRSAEERGPVVCKSLARWAVVGTHRPLILRGDDQSRGASAEGLGAAGVVFQRSQEKYRGEG